MAAEFDRVAEEAAEGVRVSEPDTLVYVIHVVPKAPMQRIIYEIYRDRAAFEIHENQPHILRFAEARKSCVLATNIIDLRLKYAKVAALFQGGQTGQADGHGPWPEPSWAGDQRADGHARRGGGQDSGYVPRALERPPWEAMPDWEASRRPDRRYGG